MKNHQQLHLNRSMQERDFRLLLHSLEKAPFNEEGKAFVRSCFSGELFWKELKEGELLALAQITQQHGLFEQTIVLLDWLNTTMPACQSGWQMHLELLHLLGRKTELAKLLPRLERALPGQAEEIKRVVYQQGLEDYAEEEQIVDPFLNMRREQDDIDLYLQIFVGRSSAFARQWADRGREKSGYVPVQRTLMADDVRDHLAGVKTYGIYLLEEDSTVRLGVLDVDLVKRMRDKQNLAKGRASVKREAIYLFKQIQERAAKAGLSCICEASGGKGYHFWFPVSAPVQAGVMKRAMQSISKNLEQDVSAFHIEVFPKQDRISGKGYGNLVKLPLGIHRMTGRNSRFLPTGSGERQAQFRLLRGVKIPPPEPFLELADQHRTAAVIPHPRHAQWAEKYPELAVLGARCSAIGQIMALLRSSKTLSLREEKILLGVLSHLERGSLLLHHLFARLSEYNRPLLDYKISKVRGTVIGCKRIHRLLEDTGRELPCYFENCSYPHPLLHLPEQKVSSTSVSEKKTNFQDALTGLKIAIEQIQRFL